MKNIMIIYNPKAGKQKYKIKIEKLYNKLCDNYHVDTIILEQQDNIEKIAYECCNKDIHLIIGCGGDGTTNRIVNGIMRSDNKVKLAILPIGSANDYSGYLRINKNVNKIVKYINNYNFTKVDVGVANEKYFINVASAGIFSDLGFAVSPILKKVLGKYAYYFSSLKYLKKYLKEENTIDIYMNGEWSTIRTSFFLVMKTSYVGGFKNIIKGVKNNDGLLHLVIVEKINFRNAVEIVTGLMMGKKLKHKKIKKYELSEIKIKSDKKLKLDLDGEYAGELPMDLSIKPGAIEILSNR